eukprot:TRINITY_DN1270_c0_g1_i1.p1 TRINITY_DN1270_c0_g1~~TRINITY_DN1270_c0_g1_i1.p1  ORF type:complete len:700 (-),score=261.58 TRINITY_DN1270_c0_g1_i1:90-2189(-)
MSDETPQDQIEDLPPPKPISGGGGDGMPSWADFMKQLEEDEANAPPPPKKTTVKRAVKKAPAASKALTPEEEEKKRKRKEEEEKNRAALRALMQKPKPVAVDVPVEIPDSSNGTSEAAPEPQAQPEPTPVAEPEVKAPEPEPTPVAPVQETTPEPVVEKPVESTPEPTPEHTPATDAPKPEEPVEEMPIKPLSGGNNSGMPSWQDFMKEMEGDAAPVEPAAAPVKRAPKPAAVKALTPEEEEKKRQRQELEKKRRDELRARIKEQRQSKPDIGVGIPDSLSGTPNTSQSQDMGEVNAALQEAKTNHVEEPTPVVEAPKPVVEEPTPVVEEHKPVVEEPKPVVEEPKPVLEVSTPQVIEEPKLVVEEPTPVVEKPAPVVEEPTPVVEKPKPMVEEPTTFVEEFKPVVEEPKVVIEKPKPNIPATPVHAPQTDAFSTPKPTEDLQQLLLRQQQLEAEKKSFEAEQLTKLRDNGFGADPLKVKEQQTHQRQEALIAQQKEQLDQQQRLLQLREQQAQLKQQAQVRSPNTAARSSTPSKTLDEFLFTDVMNDAQRGELMNLQKKAKFEEIYSKSFNERDLEEIRNRMVKQFRDVLHEYESLMMNYSASQNKEKFDKLFDENESLKRKTMLLESELGGLKTKHDQLVSQSSQAVKDLAVYRAKVQVQESRIKTLEQQLNLKLTENEKLTQLCDELITRLESSNQ